MWMSLQNSSLRAHTLTLNESPLRPPTRLKREDRNEGRYVGSTTGALALPRSCSPPESDRLRGRNRLGRESECGTALPFCISLSLKGD